MGNSSTLASPDYPTNSSAQVSFLEQQFYLHSTVQKLSRAIFVYKKIVLFVGILSAHNLGSHLVFLKG